MRIQTYDGSINELVEFVNSVWSHSYAGRMTFLHWTEDFFRWQFRLNDDSDRQNLIAAYVGERLAGVLLGTSYQCRSPAGVHGASQWSWLSIHSDFRGHGIAKALDQERIRRLTTSGSRLIISFRYFGSRHSQAERPRQGVQNQKFNRKVGFWARVIDPARFANWHWNRVEGFLAKLSDPVARIPKAAHADSSVRSFEPADLDACVNLVQKTFSTKMLSIAWDHSTLGHHLGGNAVSQTLVLREDGRITGLVNFHLLKFQARAVETVAVIDLIAFEQATSRGQVRLINAALARMQAQGAILALKVRLGDAPVWPLLRAHFIPQFADSHLVLQPVGDEYVIPRTGPIHVLWR